MATQVTLLHRSHFPHGFTFGTASSAFQIEGAENDGGRGPSIWDTFSVNKGLLTAGGKDNEGCDHYNRYKEDVKMMKEMGLDAYRFSISWPRILPKGSKKGGVNEEGIKFYNDLINELLANGIEPFVTLFHWDLPQALEDEYGGFLNRRIVDDFQDYAEVCFKEFGDRVKYWITLNEPWSFSYGGYTLGMLAPGRGGLPSTSTRSLIVRDLLPPSPFSAPSASFRRRISTITGNPGTEPYIVSHHQILAHASAVKLYREKYQKSQKATIGISLVSIWTVPLSETEEDRKAAERAVEFMFGWFMDPITFGDYPQSMKDLVKTRLPVFSKEESQLIKGSFDFLGLNYYTANYVANAPEVRTEKGNYVTDPMVRYSTERDGVLIGEKGGSSWLYVYPRGIRDLLVYIKRKYNDPIIHITENGLDEENNPELSLWEALFDHKRVSYHHDHLMFLKEAIQQGVKVKGYFTWSIMDNFEWGSAFNIRFGNNFVDYENGRKRYPKLSSGWLKFMLQKDVKAAPSHV